MPSPRTIGGDPDQPAGARLRITGIVQGVGFRPFVYRLARRMGLTGAVWNDGGDVVVEAVGDETTLERFVLALPAEAPPAAVIDRLTRTPDAALGARYADAFAVAPSHGDLPASLGVGPDLATCPRCLGEIRDPGDRRFGYALTNCTDCGPRLSILEGTPYDRPKTTMAGFAMCAVCQREYEDPADRRFHAEPNACPACGPALRFERFADGAVLQRWWAIADAFWTLIHAGGAVAIKGIGGYHLACAASDDAAVRRLRARKRRPDKPLAVMAGSLSSLSRHCIVAPSEAALLESPRAPIVLLRPRPGHAIAPSVAPGQHRIGAMLPYSPLHHLLFEGRDEILVMTSGNLSERPQVIDDVEARASFAGIADAILGHDRPIAVRVDDSVVRIDGRRTSHLRLGRGYAPVRLAAPPGLARGDVVALGGQLKSTFCLKRGGHLVLSQHAGDLEHLESREAFEASLEHYLRLYDLEPDAVAVDLHPEISSAGIGHALARAKACRLIEIQHHHAHAAACLCEHGVPAHSRPVLAIVLDGLGYGPDGALWGCELLAADYAGYCRLAHLRPVPMPGGAAAIREPWRMALAHLAARWDLDDLWRGHGGLTFFRRHEEAKARLLMKAAAQGINAPSTTSLGRLFDAVAAIAGVRDAITYEGQAAAELEAALWRERQTLRAEKGYRFDVGDTGLDPSPLWPELLADLDAGRTAGEVSCRFHLGLVDALATAAGRLCERHAGLIEPTAALSGGVFQNAFLLRALRAKLARCGWRVLTHDELPANDGGLSAGQAAIAAAVSTGATSACA